MQILAAGNLEGTHRNDFYNLKNKPRQLLTARAANLFDYFFLEFFDTNNFIE
jgi:hypothetical protein